MSIPLRVWWIPQVPGKAFRVDVRTHREAWLLIRTLADYDAFQYENRIKPDYSNMGGVEAFDDGEWSDFNTEDGRDFDELTLDECDALDAATEAK